jgi:hypothetical protein
MSIKPVLVPDHDAADLRGLMDRFADAAAGPTRQQLAESRAAVAAAQGVAEGTGQQLNIQQLATISDEALDNAYHYGRSTPGNTFGWQANLKSAAYAKQMIDQGVTDIEAISDAIHKGWNVTARAFVQNPEQFSDTEKLQAAGKLEAKLQQRAKLMNIGYAQLPDEEQEKDRVVARALLQALKGQQGVAEGKKRSDRYHIVGKDGNPASLASYADQASAVKDRDEKHPGAEVRQVGPRGKIKGVSEGIMDTVKQTFNDCVVGYPQGTSEGQFIQGWARAIRAETGRDIPLEKLTQLYQDYAERSDEIMQSHGTTNEESGERLAEFAPPDSGDGGGDDDGFDEDTLRKLAAQWFAGDEDPQVERLLAAAGWEIGQDEGYDDEPGVFVVQSGDDDGRSYMSWPAEELRSDVAEAQPDVMRHKGDTTVRVVKKGGKPIGEIGIDSEASAGNGPYYVKLYDGSYDAVGFDTAEEALAELKYAIKSAGSGPDTSFGGPGGWTGPVKEQQVDELSPKTLGSYIKKSSADAATRQGEVSGRNQFGKGAEFAVKAFYGDRIQPNPTRTDPRIAKRQAGVDQAVDRLTAEDVAEGIDPVEQLRADIRRFAL